MIHMARDTNHSNNKSASNAPSIIGGSSCHHQQLSVQQDSSPTDSQNSDSSLDPAGAMDKMKKSDESGNNTNSINNGSNIGCSRDGGSGNSDADQTSKENSQEEESDGHHGNENSNDNNMDGESGSSNGSRRRRRHKLTVTFAEDTLDSPPDTLALSIIDHQHIKELDFVEYTVKMWYSGIEWTVQKRYREFAQFHAKLMEECHLRFRLHHNTIPQLPQKRWFDKQRWFNRYDDAFIKRRRLELQSYLRRLLKIPVILLRSAALRHFLNLRVLFNEDKHGVIEAIASRHLKLTPEQSENVKHLVANANDIGPDNLRSSFNPSQFQMNDTFIPPVIMAVQDTLLQDAPLDTLTNTELSLVDEFESETNSDFDSQSEHSLNSCYTSGDEGGEGEGERGILVNNSPTGAEHLEQQSAPLTTEERYKRFQELQQQRALEIIRLDVEKSGNAMILQHENDSAERARERGEQECDQEGRKVEVEEEEEDALSRSIAISVASMDADGDLEGPRGKDVEGNSGGSSSSTAGGFGGVVGNSGVAAVDMKVCDDTDDSASLSPITISNTQTNTNHSTTIADQANTTGTSTATATAPESKAPAPKRDTIQLKHRDSLFTIRERYLQRESLDQASRNNSFDNLFRLNTVINSTSTMSLFADSKAYKSSRRHRERRHRGQTKSVPPSSSEHPPPTSTFIPPPAAAPAPATSTSSSSFLSLSGARFTGSTAGTASATASATAAAAVIDPANTLAAAAAMIAADPSEAPKSATTTAVKSAAAAAAAAAAASEKRRLSRSSSRGSSPSTPERRGSNGGGGSSSGSSLLKGSRIRAASGVSGAVV